MLVTSAGIYEICSTFHLIQKQDLLNGPHVCRHTEGAVAVSGDQHGEQAYNNQGKQAGGLKDISTNPQEVAVWI